jgi:hypothetical protein
VRSRAVAAVLLAAAGVGACGGADRPRATPEAAVRASVARYLRTMADRRWARACSLMTAGARRDVAAAAGAPCARALADGAALDGDELATAARAVDGADVRIDGAVATVGPLGGLAVPLRLRRVGGRWLVDG